MTVEYTSISVTKQERAMIDTLRMQSADVAARYRANPERYLTERGRSVVRFKDLEPMATAMASFVAKIVEPLRQQIAQLRADLEATMADRGGVGVKWGGKYEPGRRYYEGELVQKNGLWLCTTTETTSTPGTSLTDWKLIVHRRLVPHDDDQSGAAS